MYAMVTSFSLLVAAAGWFYLFYSKSASRLATVESARDNFYRVLCRRINGVAMILLAILSILGGWFAAPHLVGGTDYFEKFLHPVFAAYAPKAGIEQSSSLAGSAGESGEIAGSPAMELIHAITGPPVIVADMVLLLFVNLLAHVKLENVTSRREMEYGSMRKNQNEHVDLVERNSARGIRLDHLRLGRIRPGGLYHRCAKYRFGWDGPPHFASLPANRRRNADVSLAPIHFE